MSAVYRSIAPLVSPQHDAAVIAAGIGARLRAGAPRVRNIYFGGTGRIAGTVKRASTPANIPLVRQVLLYCERTRCLVASTWSAPDGSYAFESIDRSGRFTVIAYDHLHEYRAVIADNLTPEPMP